MKKAAVFFDRDGIVVKPVGGEAPQKNKDLELVQEVIPIIKRIQSFGYLTFIISNQPDAAEGRITKKTKQRLEGKFKKLLKKNNLSFTEIFYCYHRSSQKCSCRKPKSGMLLKAEKKYKFDLKNSFIVGDRASDIKAGNLAGTKTILFDPKNRQKKHLISLATSPDFRVSSLLKLEKIIISNSFPSYAIILAAGRGERMMPLTKNVPKPLLKINGKPIINYTIHLLSKHSVQKIGINLFYLGERIEKFLSDGKKYGVNIVYVKEKSLTGTAGGVKKVAYKLKPNQPFFVISSDMLINFDLRKIYQYHLSHQGIATVCCYFRNKKQLEAKKSGLVIFNKKSKKLLTLIEKPQTQNQISSQWINSSVYVFSPKILDYIPSKIGRSRIVDIPKDILLKLLKSKEKIYAYPISKKYYQLGIDTPDRLKKAEADIASGKFIPTL